MAKLLLCPLSAGYAAQQKTGVLSVELDGGASRYRRDVLNSAFNLNVAWACDAEKYEYLCAFYRTATVSGSLPFAIDLVLDDSAMTEYDAYFVPGTFRLAQVEGSAVYRVEATLEVLKDYNAGESSADAAIISAYESAHGESP